MTSSKSWNFLNRTLSFLFCALSTQRLQICVASIVQN